MLYDRSAPTHVEVVDEWDNGIGWMTHPEEKTQRTSHAIQGADGVWVFDPLDGPGIEDRLNDLGSVAGVAILSNYHSRDATVFAERHGVPVYLPRWMSNAADHVEAEVVRYNAPDGQWVELGESGIEVRTVNPATAWREAIAYRPSEKTLRVADLLSTNSFYRIGDERLGCYFLHRFAPPREVFTDIDPKRILLGHGEGIFDEASETLESALDNARRNLPRAVFSQAPTQIRGMIGAIRG